MAEWQAAVRADPIDWLLEPSDPLVMGSGRRTGLVRLVLGSGARNVLQHATCSVLVVREGPTRG